MKKLFLMMGAAAVSLNLAACSGKAAQTPEPQTASVSQETETEMEKTEETYVESDADIESGEESREAEDKDLEEALFSSCAYAVQMEITTGLTTEGLDGLMNYPVSVNLEEPVELKSYEDLEKFGLDALYTEELKKALENCDIDSLSIENGRMVVGDPDGANVVLEDDGNGLIGITEFNYGI